jgi:hypothetical protein
MRAEIENFAKRRDRDDHDVLLGSESETISDVGTLLTFIDIAQFVSAGQSG